MASPGLERAADTSDRELLLTRVFDAPIGVVFDAWTNPAHLPHWWGPYGFTTTIKEFEVRPGGVFRYIMRGPDGREYHYRVVFTEVAKPRRLVYQHDPEADCEPVHAETTVDFKDEGRQTRLIKRMVFPSAAEREYIIDTYHADEGFEQTLARLSEHLGQIADDNKHFFLKRIFAAPRPRVFKAWIDQKQLAQWWGPSGFTNPVCEVNVRAGGRILIHMRGPDGTEYPMQGHFVEIAEPEKLVFVTRVNEAVSGTRFEIQNTVTFLECGQEQTELTIEVRVMNATEAAQGSLAGARMGWTQSLERLDILIELGSRRQK